MLFLGKFSCVCILVVVKIMLDYAPDQVMPFSDHLASLGKPASSIISLFKATQVLYSTLA